MGAADRPACNGALELRADNALKDTPLAFADQAFRMLSGKARRNTRTRRSAVDLSVREHTDIACGFRR